MNTSKAAKAHAKIAEGHAKIAEGQRELSEAILEQDVNRDVYTSASAGPFPPGKSRDWTRRNLPKIRGAYRVGQAWCISTDDFLAWARARDEAQVKAEVAPAKLPNAESVVASALAAVGMRRAG